TAAARTGRRDHERVERGAAALVGIEAVSNELAQESATLGVAIPDGPPQRARRLAQLRMVRAVLQVRREIANRCQSKTGDRRSFRLIYDFIDADTGVCRKTSRASVVDKLPAIAWDRHGHRIHARAKCQGCLALARVDRAVSESDLDPSSAVRLDVRLTYEPLDGRDRCLKCQPLGRRHIELPAEEGHGESLLEKESVAHVPRFRREVTLLNTAHDPEGLIAAAIDDLQEHAPPCAVRLFWSEEQQVRGELDLALGISWSNVDVGN